MKKLLSPFILITALLQHSVHAVESPQVAVSIKPIHSLVSGVMEGVGTPQLIVKSGSPHGYTLRPSEARTLSHADLVIWVGHELESFLDKPLKTLAKDAKKLELADQLAGSLLTKRDFGNWEQHDHSEHAAHDDDHDDHKEHAAHDDDHDDHKEHAVHDDDHDDHKEHAAHDDDHDEHEEHVAHDDDDDHDGHEEHAAHDDYEGSMDLHIWLSPSIAQKIVDQTSKMLIEIDPANAKQYEINTVKMTAKITKLDQQLQQKLAPIQTVPYLVFHSAYQYFETSYNLNAVGSVTIDPERKPGAKRITEIRKKVRDLKARAVFSEPQFESKLVTTIIEDTGAKTATLDPLGANITAGPDAYFELMNNLADDLVKGLE
ncbi:zinc ABC transporter substrate-binding protein [uncultured Psychromonas sp.]|uniref:zinc ABC transporter substrate-binding protein n=1 Tax=uncultured Psychromonas sp. TaxID=173974 RepID=UPI00261B0424|nr:zinc ABC transporter substrate-binding protein [uncultured Psychromonas sp.]